MENQNENTLIFKPVVCYTDASIRHNYPLAVCSIIVFSKYLSVPAELTHTMQFREELSNDPDTHGYTGIIKAFDINSTELMSIWACVKMAAPQLQEDEKLLIYTDNLSAKKILKGAEAAGKYRTIAAEILNDLEGKAFDVRKVAGHEGITGNELADFLAKRRLNEVAFQ